MVGVRSGNRRIRPRLLECDLRAWLLPLAWLACALAALAGDVQISASGHYFLYKGKAKMVLADSGTQCVMQNLNVDYRSWVDTTAAEGDSSLHIWAFVPPRQKLDESKLESRWGYLYPGATPWVRQTSGPDAYDGGKQWDLFTFDEGSDPDAHYWRRLRDLCQRSKSNGMMLGVTVFFGWPKDTEDFKYHPFASTNGGPAATRQDITHIEEPGTEIHTQPWNVSWPVRKRTQWLWEKFCLKLINETSPYTNVRFDFRDEWSYDTDTNMEAHFRAFFMSRSQIWADRATNASFRVANGSVPSFGVTPTMKTEGGPYDHDGVRVEVWSRGMSGIHYLLHNDSRSPGIMAWDTNTAAIKGTDPDDDLGRNVGYASKFFNTGLTGLDTLLPDNGLVNNSAKCLAETTTEYAVYVPSGNSTVTVDLTAMAGLATARFYDSRTGLFDTSFATTGGASRVFSIPDTNDWALHILADSVDATAPGKPSNLTVVPE